MPWSYSTLLAVWVAGLMTTVMTAGPHCTSSSLCLVFLLSAQAFKDQFHLVSGMDSRLTSCLFERSTSTHSWAQLNRKVTSVDR